MTPAPRSFVSDTRRPRAQVDGLPHEQGFGPLGAIATTHTLPRKAPQMPSKRIGPTESAVTADLKQYDLERFPTARSLGATALVLARQLDAEPNAAVARELRLVLADLARVTVAQQDDALEAFLADLSAPITIEARPQQ